MCSKNSSGSLDWSSISNICRIHLNCLPSLSLIFTALYRVLNRENHETINGTDPERALVVLNFVTSYYRHDTFKTLCDKTLYDAVIEVPFNNEGWDDLFPNDFKYRLINI